RDLVSQDRLDAQSDQPVVEQQYCSRSDVARQRLVVEPDALRIAEIAVGVEDEGLSDAERYLAVRKLADADLGPLQVGHDRDLSAERLRRPAHELGALLVIGRGAVRKVESDDVDTRGQHAGQYVLGTARGSDGGDDLGGALHGFSWRFHGAL